MDQFDRRSGRFRDGDRESKILLDALSKIHQKLDAALEISREQYGQKHEADFGLRHRERVFPRTKVGEHGSQFFNFKGYVPDFYGSSRMMDVWNWVDEMDDYFEKNDLSKQIQYKVAIHKLKGDARLWWENSLLEEADCDCDSGGKYQNPSRAMMRKLLICRYPHTSCLTKLRNGLSKNKCEEAAPHAKCSTKVLFEPYIDNHDRKEIQPSGFEPISPTLKDADSVEDEVNAQFHGITNEKGAPASSICSNFECTSDDLRASKTILSSLITDTKPKKNDIESDEHSREREVDHTKCVVKFPKLSMSRGILKSLKSPFISSLPELEFVTSGSVMTKQKPNLIETRSYVIKGLPKIVENEFQVQGNFEFKNWSIPELLGKFIKGSCAKSLCTVSQRDTIHTFREFVSFLFDLGGNVGTNKGRHHMVLQAVLRVCYMSFDPGGNHFYKSLTNDLRTDDESENRTKGSSIEALEKTSHKPTVDGINMIPGKMWKVYGICLALLYMDKSRRASKLKHWKKAAKERAVVLLVWYCRKTIFGVSSMVKW